MSISVVSPLYGQSNYDLALQERGGLDSYVDFLNKNNISNSNTEASAYLFDTNSVINKLIAGKRYATKNIEGRFFDPEFFDTSFFE